MLTFLFMIFPVSLLIYFVNPENRKNIIVAFTGLVTGLLVCMYRWLFVQAHRVVPYSFGANYGHFLMQHMLVPVFVLYGLFFLISRNDLEFKIKAFFPLICSYYIIFMPYSVTSATDYIFSSYEIFVKPAVYLLAIMLISASLISGYKLIKKEKKNFATGCFVLAFLILFIPSLLDAMSAMGGNTFIVLIWSLVLLAIPSALLIVLNKITA